MKQKLKLFKESELFMLIIMLVCSLFGVCDAGAMMADVVVLPEGGVADPGGINSDQFTRENPEDLNLNDVQRRVVRVNMGAHAMTQFGFFAEKESATSRIQEYYLTDVLPSVSTLKTAYAEPSGNGANGVETVTLDTNNNAIFSAKETIIFPEIKGYKENGTVQLEQYFMAYILKKNDEGKLIVKATNGKAIGGVSNSIPALPAGTKMLRSGRAHNEIDMRTPPFAIVPIKTKQYLQTFRCQIEETTLEKIAKKEAD